MDIQSGIKREIRYTEVGLDSLSVGCTLRAVCIVKSRLQMKYSEFIMAKKNSKREKQHAGAGEVKHSE